MKFGPAAAAVCAAALGGLLVALALVGRGGSGNTALYQRWNTLKPNGVLRADEDFGPPSPRHKARRSALKLKPFFGLQHFDKSGHGMAAAGMRRSGLEPSIKAAGTQMLHQKGKQVNLPALWTATQAQTKTQALRDYTPQSSFIDITSPDATDADGYVDASAYRSELSANAVQGQAAYVANWKAKNLKGAKQMVKDAAKLYSKWDLVDPTTGRSSPNLVIPHDSSDGFDTARSPVFYKNGPMLTDAHLMMLKEVTADNGRTFVLPWWCVVVHPEANGDGQPTGLSDAYGRKYPEGKGWDGAKTPMGASGIPGVDCTHPGGSTLVPYDKDWPLWKGPRVTPEAEAEPVSDEEAAELEEGEEEAAEEEPEEEPEEEEPTEEDADGEEGEEPAAEEDDAGAEEPEPAAETEEPEPVEGEEGGEGETTEAAAEEEPAVEEPAAERDVASEQMLASEFPSLTWRHGINTDNALNKPGKATTGLNSDGPEYNVMEDDFVFPDYKSSTQMLFDSSDPNGNLESDDLGDEIFELPQDYGDVQVNPDDLEVQMFPGHYY